MCNIGYRSIYSVSWRTSNKITFSLPYSACWMFTVLLICYAACTGFSFGDRTAISHDCKTPSIDNSAFTMIYHWLTARSLQLLHTYIRTDVRNCSALSRLAYWQAAGNNNYDNLYVFPALDVYIILNIVSASVFSDTLYINECAVIRLFCRSNTLHSFSQ